MKNLTSFLLRFSVSAILLWYIFSKIDIGQTVEVLKTADLRYILYAAFFFFLIYLILIWRWVIFIHALGLAVSKINILRYFFIGLFGNLFLPTSIGGDVIKVIGLCRETPQKAKVVASVLLDRLSGFVGIVLVAIFSYSLGYRFIQDTSLLISIFFIGGVPFLITFVIFNQKLYRLCCAVFNKLPKIKSGLMNMHDDIMLLKGKRQKGLKAIGLSCLAQIILSLTFYLTAQALHADIGMIYFLIFVPLICVASSLPSIGGLGVREVGAAYLFTKVGVSSEIAVSLSLMNFLLMVIFGVFGGLFYVSTLSFGRIQCYSPDA